MQEKTLLKISLCAVLLGLGFIYFYVGELALPPVADADSFSPGEEVIIKGEVKRLAQKEKVIFLEVEGERVETNAVVVFNDEEIFLREGDLVEITGTVEEYQGKKEIIAQKVVLKSGEK